MEWLATAIRAYRGEASVVEVQAFDDLPDDRLRRLFMEARSRDYQRLLHETKKWLALSSARKSSTSLNRVRRRLQQLQEIDFFGNPLRARLEALLLRADEGKNARRARRKSDAYINKVWITRPRPGIDRVSSAWLIRQFIDPRARFVFGTAPEAYPDAIPFEMFTAQGFGHRGDDCTFETLCKEFAIRDSRVKRIAQIIHDTDLDDEKFGRSEGHGLDKVLNGWAKDDVPDDELLARGMELIDGLYHGLA